MAERDDGTVVRGRIPDRAIQPRLLYHRHFMLTEHMAQAPPELQEKWYGSYAQHLGRKYGATRVSLTRQTHLPPDDGDGPPAACAWTTRPATTNSPWGSSDATRSEPGRPLPRGPARSLAEGWDAFWFTPADPTLLGLLRVLTGLMLLYTHAVWGLALDDFFGPTAWLEPSWCGRSQADKFAYSFWWLVPPGWLWPALRRLDGGPGAVHDRALDPRDVAPGAGRGDLVRPPRTRRRCSAWTRSTSC